MAAMCVFGCPRATALELPLGNTVSSLFPYAHSKPNHLEELGDGGFSPDDHAALGHSATPRHA